MREFIAHTKQRCSKCSREISVGETFFKTGKEHPRKNRPYGLKFNVKKNDRFLGVRIFCVDCIDSCYVDGLKVSQGVSA